MLNWVSELQDERYFTTHCDIRGVPSGEAIVYFGTNKQMRLCIGCRS